MNKENILKLLFSFLILIAVIFIVVQKRNTSLKQESYKSSNQLIKELPDFNVKDINNQIISASDLKGKNLYFQFIDTKNPYDIELFEKVYKNWNNKNITIVALPDNINRFTKHIKNISYNDTKIIPNGVEYLKKKFNNYLSYGYFFIFNENSQFYISGSNNRDYKDSVRLYLNKKLKNKFFKIENFIKKNSNIKNMGYFEQIYNLIKDKNKKYYLISLFIDFCPSCFEGQLINKLKKIYSKSKNKVFILSVLGKGYNKIDAESCRKQLQLEFPVIIANKKLKHRWTDLAEEYGTQYLKNIVILLNKDKKVIKILSKDCNCAVEFFNYLNQIL